MTWTQICFLGSFNYFLSIIFIFSHYMYIFFTLKLNSCYTLIFLAVKHITFICYIEFFINLFSMRTCNGFCTFYFVFVFSYFWNIVFIILII